MRMDPSFPTYRRSANGRHFYRIEGARAFTEVHLVGDRALIHRVQDAAYPEQVRIKAMLDLEGDAFLVMEAIAFERLLDLHDGR